MDQQARTLRSGRTKKGSKPASEATSVEPGPSYIAMSAVVEDDYKVAIEGLSQNLADKSWELSMLYEEKDRLQSLNKMVMKRMTEGQVKLSTVIVENETNKAEIARLTQEIEALRSAQQADEGRSSEMELKDKYFKMKEAELAEKIREINSQSEKNTLIVVESDKLNQQQRNEIARLQKSQESLMSQLRSLKEDFENQQNEYELTLNSLKATIEAEKSANLDLTYQIKSLAKSLERVEEDKMSLMTEYEMSEITLNKTSSNASSLDKLNKQLQAQVDELKHKLAQQELSSRTIFELKEQDNIKKSSLVSELTSKLALLETRYSESSKLNAVEIERLKEFQQSLIAQLSASKELSANADQVCQDLRQQLGEQTSALEALKLEHLSAVGQLQVALDEANSRFRESSETSQRNLAELASLKRQLGDIEARKREETAYLRRELDIVACEFDKLAEEAKAYRDRASETGRLKDAKLREMESLVRDLEAKLAELESTKQDEIGQLAGKHQEQLAKALEELKQTKDHELTELASSYHGQLYEVNSSLHSTRGELSVLQDSLVSVNLAHEAQFMRYEARIKALDSTIQELKQENQRRLALDREQREETDQLLAEKQRSSDQLQAAQESISELTASCQAQTAEIKELRAQLADLGASLSEKEAELTKAQQEVQQHLAKLTTMAQLDQRLADMTAHLASLEEAQRLSVLEFESKIGQLEGQIESQTAEMESKDSALKAYQTDLVDRDSQIERLKRWIDVVEEYLLDLERDHKLHTFEQAKVSQVVDQFYAQQLEQCQEEIGQLRREHESYLQSSAEMQSERDQLVGQLDELQSQLEDLSSERQQLLQSNAQLGEQFESLQQTNDHNLNVIADLEEKLQTARLISEASATDIQNLQEELEAARTKLGNLEESNSNYAQMFKAVEQEKAELKSQLESLTSAHQELTTRYEEAGQITAALESELEQAKSAAADQLAEIERLSSLRAEISRNALKDLELKDEQLLAKDEEIAELSDQVSSGKQELQKAREDHESQLTSLKETIEAEKARCVQVRLELSESLTNSQHSVETHQAEIEDLKDQLNKMFVNQDVLVHSEKVLIERLTSQLGNMEVVLEHSQRLQDKYSQQDELVSKLDECLNESKTTVSQLLAQVRELAQQLEQAGKEKDSLSQEIESAAQTIQSQSDKIDELHKLLDELVAKSELSSAEKTAMLKEIGELQQHLSKQGEAVASLQKDNETKEELLAKLKADKLHAEAQHLSKCKQFESNIGCLLSEIQALKKTMASLEKTNSLKLAELGDKTNEIAELRQEKAHLESQVRKAKETFEDEYKSMVSKLSQRSEEYETLQVALDSSKEAHAKLEAMLREAKASVSELQSANSQLKQQVLEHKVEIKQLESSIAKLSQESQRYSESHQATKKRLEEAKELNKAVDQELASVKASSADLADRLRTLELEKHSLKSQKEALTTELAELKLKSSQELTTREELQKIAMSFKQQFEMLQKQHAALKLSHDEQEAELKQLQLRSASNAMSGALSSLIEKQSDASLQSKIDDLTDQRHRHLLEIESLRGELEQLKGKLTTELDRLSQEHQKSASDKQHQYEKSLNKRTQEIKKLRETTKEMQETNDFLANQITNLNKLIYDLNHGKENEADRSTVSCKTPLTGTSVAKSSDMVTPLNKTLLGVKDMNKLASKPSSNELASKSSTDSIPMTPSSTIRKQNQCAQQ